jgi:aerobic carbon-monoxide dehydrogenase medium subunit
MKPSRFQYHRPRSVTEAIEVKHEHDLDAAFLAGGQSLMPILNMRLARPEVLIDLNWVTELDGVQEVDDGWVKLGAMTRHAAVECDATIAAGCPLVTEALSNVAHPVIRNRGTVGGSAAHADVAAELPTALVALGGRIVAQGPDGTRVIDAADFFQFHFTTSLDTTELVTALMVPRLDPSSGYAFLEISRRHGDFALASVAMTLTDGVARMAFGGVSSRPVFVESAEEDPATDAVAAVSEVGITDDLSASRAYRTRLIATLARRARAVALARMNDGVDGD